ncbi:MAG: MliC family protein [Candidatus Paceibacterota bacterium]|jgi:membrane-bound inhibitor of C-type lysozyme
MNKYQSIIFFLAAAVFVGWLLLRDVENIPLPTANIPIATVLYLCDGEKTLSAAYYKGPEAPVPDPGEPPMPTGSIELSIDGQASSTLAQTISVSGIRYANPDESLVFWSKGDSVLIMRNNSMDLDYTNCVAVPAVRVISPAAGDIWKVGETRTITWVTQSIPPERKISISIRRIPPPPLQEEGQEFDPLVFVHLTNTGSVGWTIPDMYPDGMYVFGITSYESVPVMNPVSNESAPFRITREKSIGGQRDERGCLGPAGYTFSEDVGSCLRVFEMTPDIMKAARIAVERVGRGYALTVVSFNSYEEAGAYDIMLERGVAREKTTILIRNWKVGSVVAE